jgi:hypothetical protein
MLAVCCVRPTLCAKDAGEQEAPTQQDVPFLQRGGAWAGMRLAVLPVVFQVPDWAEVGRAASKISHRM